MSRFWGRQFPSTGVLLPQPRLNIYSENYGIMRVMDSDKIAPPNPQSKAKEFAVACNQEIDGEYYYIVTLDNVDLPYLLEGETVIVEYRRRRAINELFVMDDEVMYAGA